MADPTQRQVPKGQPKGQAQQQQQFLADAPQQGAPPPQQSSDPALGPGDLSSALGDLSMLLMEPTERPEESPLSLPVEQDFELREAAVGPSDQYRRLATDPRMSANTRSLAEFVLRLRMLEPPPLTAPAPDLEPPPSI